MSIRTDIHSPKNFDPNRYQFKGWVYLGTSEVAADAINQYETLGYMEEHERVGVYGPSPLAAKCDHCGSWFAYGAVFEFDEGGYILVGHDCASGRFRTTDRFEFELAYLRRRVSQTRDSLRKSERVAQYLDDSPKVAEAFEWADEMVEVIGETLDWEDRTEEQKTLQRMVGWNTNTIRDIRSKLLRYGSISEKQEAFVVSLAQKGAEKLTKAKQRAKEVAQMEPLKAGRQEIEGAVISVKLKEYGLDSSFKMLVALESGHRVYGTMPKAFSEEHDRYCRENEFLTLGEYLKGARVRFTAQLKPEIGSNDFAIFSRPTKAELVELAQPKQ